MSGKLRELVHRAPMPAHTSVAMYVCIIDTVKSLRVLSYASFYHVSQLFIITSITPHAKIYGPKSGAG